MGTAFTFLARSAIERIPRKEVKNNTKALKLILEVYQMGTKTVPEQKALYQLHEHVDITKLGFDKKELANVKAYVEKITGPLPKSDDSSDDDDYSSATAPTSSAADEDADEDDKGEDDDKRVFPPGLKKASDVPGVSNAWGFRCELCGHICVQTRHFYAHFKEGRGVESLRIFRAIKTELVWWAKDPEGNEYTGELVELTEKPKQPPIPAPCGDRIRAANNEKQRIRRANAIAKRNAAAEQKSVAGTKRKRDEAEAEAEAETE